MTEITRVPLQPIARGSLGKLWVGVAAAVLAAGGIAWAAMPPQVDVDTLVAGEGPRPTLNDVAVINYKGTLANGKVFDEARNAIFPLTGVIPGFTKALQQMQAGGRYKVHIPASLAYGSETQGEIPPDSDLNFDIEVIAFMTREQAIQQMQMMQMQQQMHGGGPEGALPPEGPPPAP